MSMVTKLVVLSVLTYLVSSEEEHGFNDAELTRYDCTYNGTKWSHGTYNNTNPECRFYWCNNGTMEIYNCTNGPPPTYSSCQYVRWNKPFPRCCHYVGAC
uniref:8.9 kDa family member n=1 Tax=Rhipicephalus zambeziensis TaxID=60191 RepID=A0A224YBY7_9ACAR